MDVHRHAAAVVRHLQRAVLEQGHLDQVAVARQGFIDAVVDDFMARWLGREVSVYMPGRRRTGSRPDRTSMSEAL
jgi:hypothetical protein